MVFQCDVFVILLKINQTVYNFNGDLIKSLFLFGRAGSACAFAMLSVISLRSFIRYSEVVSFLLTFPPARRRAFRSNFAALARASYQQKRKQRSTNL